MTQNIERIAVLVTMILVSVGVTAFAALDWAMYLDDQDPLGPRSLQEIVSSVPTTGDAVFQILLLPHVFSCICLALWCVTYVFGKRSFRNTKCTHAQSEHQSIN